MALQGIDIASSGIVRNVQVDPVGGLVLSPGIVDTISGSSSVAAPASGANIALIAAGSVPAGQYRVTVFFFFSGGTNETQVLNLRLFSKGVAALTGFPTLAQQNVVQQWDIPRVSTDGANPIAIRAVATATAGTIYNVYLQATRIT